jgi:hypothetical protein
MKKKMIVLLTAASLMATAGIASADGTLALYGSSAQAKYWNAQAATWLTSLGCSTPTTAAAITGAGAYAGTTHYKISASGCTNADAAAIAGAGVLTVLYTANDSVTGIQSVKGSVNADGCGSANQRVMYPATGTANCQTVHLGVSDVAAESIIQQSSGHKIGPLDATATIFSPNFSVPTSAASLSIKTTGLTAITPNATLATPFGFYANKAVTATQCTAGLIGNYCNANTQCDTAYNSGNGVCNTTATTISNINRLQATLLFSGQVPSWDYLGTYFTANPVVLCLRHAGSGTHATFVNAVMNAGGTGWGTSVLGSEDPVGPPVTWFNNASADEMNCINGDTLANNSGSAIGAIGYADADAAPAANVVELKYNGNFPTRSAMRNGLYDFYAIAWFYTNNSNSSAINQLAKDMVIWSEDPTHMAASKVNYWATAAEMNYVKGSDQSYPGYAGATSPMTP